MTCFYSVSRYFCILSTALFLTLAISVTHVFAEPDKNDIIVMHSTEPGIKARKIFRPGENLKIRKGREIEVMLPKGETVTIKGPFDGPARDLKGYSATKGGNTLAAVWKFFTTGGTTSTPVSVRGGALHLGNEPLLRPEAKTSGPISLCLERAVSYKFEYKVEDSSDRPDNTGKDKSDKPVEIQIGLAEGQMQTLSLPKDVDELAWPSQYPVSSGRIYSLDWSGDGVIDVQFQLVRPGSLQGARRLSTFVVNGCKLQAVRWLENNGIKLK